MKLQTKTTVKLGTRGYPVGTRALFATFLPLNRVDIPGGPAGTRFWRGFLVLLRIFSRILTFDRTFFEVQTQLWKTKMLVFRKKLQFFSISKFLKYITFKTSRVSTRVPHRKRQIYPPSSTPGTLFYP